MPAMADAVRLLSTYGDLLGLLGLLPMIWNVKFGRLIHAQELAEKAKKKAAVAAAAGAAAPKQQAKPAPAAGGVPPAAAQEAGTAEEDEMPECTPPVWILCLLLAAEVISSAHLLDRRDKQVARAVGAIMRVQQKKPSGVEAVLTSVAKLLKDADVYDLVRFSSAFGGLGSLLVTSWLGSKQLDTFTSEVNPLRNMRSLAALLARSLWMPRLWCALLLATSFGLGHWSLLAKVLDRPAGRELLQAAVGLLRALAATGVALQCPYKGPTPVWASFLAAGAAVRACRAFLHERVPWSEVLEGGVLVEGGRAVVAGVQGALAMEAWGALVLLPCALRRRRLVLLLPLLVAPGVVLATGSPGSALAVLEAHTALSTHRLAITVAFMSLMMLFLGGFSIMFMYMLLAQILIRIHHLDKIKF